MAVKLLDRWDFTCDRAATEAAYAIAEPGYSQTCTCNGCRNFRQVRDIAFPKSFRDLLRGLGIDPAKDGEVYLNGRVAPGQHHYAGWFHFVGTLEKDIDFSVEIEPGFQVWLSSARAPHLDALDGLPLVQLEFAAENVPWVLDEPETD